LVELRTRLSPEWRLAIGAVAGALVMCVLGLYYGGHTGPGALDAGVQGAIDSQLGDHPGLLHALVLPTQPYVLLPVIALAIVVCLLAHRRRDAALAALGPAVAVAANTWALKPLFDRQNNGFLAYPSGHTVSLVSTLTVLVLLARPGALRGAVVAVGAALLVVAGIGMIGLDYHYFTDIVGGTFFAVAVVCALRLAVLGLATSRLSPRPWQGPLGG
jgi:membrane-associated phospholipid phosphatase